MERGCSVGMGESCEEGKKRSWRRIKRTDKITESIIKFYHPSELKMRQLPLLYDYMIF